jgi:hypothetical protein
MVITAAHLFEGRQVSGLVSPILRQLEQSDLLPSIGGSNSLPLKLPPTNLPTATTVSGQAGSAPIEVLFMPPDDSPNASKPFPDIFKGISRTPAALILLNEAIDLAILQITPTGRTPVKLANQCAVGQKIMAPSYKHGKELIFPLADVVNITDDGIIYNASAGSGSSGGPIVNLNGELVGICKGSVEGGLKIMVANHKTIRAWFTDVEEALKGITGRR